MTREKQKSLNIAAAAILQAIDSQGTEGAKGGVLYAALMATGYTFAEYQHVMGALQGNKFVQRHSLERYTLTDAGRAMNAKVTAAIARNVERAAA